MSQLQAMTIEELIDEFDFLGDWEDKCDYLIDLGFELPAMPPEAKTEANRVHGCQSMVWLTIDVRNENGEPVIDILADSDAMIVKGLIAVLLTLYSGKTPRDILSTDPRSVFARLGLAQQLSTARKNGLMGMVQRVRALAEAHLEGGR